MEGPKIYGELFGLPITQTLVNTWIIMALILVVCYILTKNMQIKRPGKAQVIAETIVTALDDLVGQTMGKDKMKFAPYMLALIMFLAFSNTAGIYGLRSPTADLNCTVGLALMTFFLTQFFGLKSKGLGGYLKGFFEPMPFLFPINVIGEFANPVSLSFRLFGNMLGGGIIMALLYSALAGLIFFPVLIPVPFHFYFDIFSGLLQSFIFTMLTMVFISGAMD
ncbi:F0F1 ATP synthase subunit A [Acetobacterium woodii]|uniref:ATP synthase subunit a n=1 Tax=Acetobacterium woodii (strain ATCC 29683 / DSM 1030 / JCM 2381 / KCTC 1655 / WB1) TaxID=931626 RepID=H6LFS9_ACEWD|nr:F0F1 ATP synthase subunit A [Acetobacterium woodii]AFA47024.1 F-type ATP synthase subunit A [Acetobacterium woodii DSM 1030]